VSSSSTLPSAATGGGLTRAAVRAANTLTARWGAALGGPASTGTDTGSGTAYSAMGVWPLLGLMYAGADEPGRTELGAAFGFLPEEPSEVADVVRSVVELFDRGAGLSLAMGMWRRADLSVHEDWLALLPPATRGVLSGDARQDQRALDAWVERYTSGQLTRMPVQLNPDIRLLLASALTVETEWRTLFKRTASHGVGPWEDTRLALLRRRMSATEAWLAPTPGGPVTVSLLEGRDDVDVYLLLGEEGRASSSVLGDGIAALDSLREAGIPSAAWESDRAGDDVVPGVEISTILSTTGAPETRLECVAFSLSAEHDLLHYADVFGLGHVSTFGNRFPGISDEPIYLNQARQNVVAEFTEMGFKAAAVTAMGFATAAMVRPAASEVPLTTISYTRPFGFAAVHRDTGLVLVAGWVAKPDAP
jgi:serine protease inhibitor